MKVKGSMSDRGQIRAGVGTSTDGNSILSRFILFENARESPRLRQLTETRSHLKGLNP